MFVGVFEGVNCQTLVVCEAVTTGKLFAGSVTEFLAVVTRHVLCEHVSQTLWDQVLQKFEWQSRHTHEHGLRQILGRNCEDRWAETDDGDGRRSMEGSGAAAAATEATAKG